MGCQATGQVRGGGGQVNHRAWGGGGMGGGAIWVVGIGQGAEGGWEGGYEGIVLLAASCFHLLPVRIHLLLPIRSHLLLPIRIHLPLPVRIHLLMPDLIYLLLHIRIHLLQPIRIYLLLLPGLLLSLPASPRSYPCYCLHRPAGGGPGVLHGAGGRPDGVGTPTHHAQDAAATTHAYTPPISSGGSSSGFNCRGRGACNNRRGSGVQAPAGREGGGPGV